MILLRKKVILKMEKMPKNNKIIIVVKTKIPPNLNLPKIVKIQPNLELKIITLIVKITNN